LCADYLLALTGLGRGDIGAPSRKKKIVSKKEPKEEQHPVDTDKFYATPKVLFFIISLF
jgi:hypothetical protein